MPIKNISTKLKEEGWSIKEEFIQNLEDQSLKYQDVLKLLLSTDFKVCGCSSLSGDVLKGKAFIKTPLVLQVTNVNNVPSPKSNQESGAAPRMLKLTLTDGVNFINGLEVSYIDTLSLKTAPGTKVKLISDIISSGSILLLKPSNIQLLGGVVEDLYKKWKISEINGELIHSKLFTSMMSDSAGQSQTKKAKRYYTQSFKEEWLNLPELKTWLKRDSKDSDSGYCKCCEITLKNYNKSMILKHSNSEKHKRNYKVAETSCDFSQFLLKKQSKESETLAKSELLIAAYFAEHDIPFTTVDHFLATSKRIFPDSKIAEKLCLKRTKLTYLMQDGIALHERQSQDKICRAQKFSIIVDESTDISVTQVLAIVVRYFDKNASDVVDRLLDTVVVEDGSASGLYSSLKDLLHKREIPLPNIIGLGADNCSTMMGTKNGFQKLLRDDVPNVFIMGCICHSFALCASHAVTVLPSFLEGFLKDLTSYFSRSSKRKNDFQLIQEAASAPKHQIPKLAQTRWLSRENVISAILENYDALTLYFRTEAKVDKVDGAHRVYNVLINSGTKHMLYFLQYFLKKVNTLNVEFQSENFRLHSLYMMVTSEYKNILSCFVKDDVMQRLKLSDIDPSDTSNHKKIKEIFLGGLTMVQLMNEPLSSNILTRFVDDCVKFLVELCGQIKKRFPLSEDSLIAQLKVLDPAIASNTNVAPHFLTGLISTFPNLVKQDEVNELEDQWRNYRVAAKDIQQYKPNDSIPQYWYNLGTIKDGLGNLKFGLLSNFMVNLTCLPHSSACVERIFSKVNHIKTKKTNSLKTETTADRILAKQAIQKNHGDCTKWEPSQALVKDVENGKTHSIYVQRLEDAKELITLEAGEEEDLP